MAIEVASLKAVLGLDDSQFNHAIGGVRGKLGSLAGTLGTALGGAAVAGVAVGAAAIAGIGTAAVKTASDFQQATAAIVTGTGASGDQLAAMEDTVKRLSGSTAGLNADFGTMGAVVAEVNTRTGATGEALENFSAQMLNLSRLTGGDAVRDTQLITRVMGDWGVSMKDSAALTDKLFGASQAFGISVEDLSAKVVRFGAPMRQMGFSLEESVALFGKWEKEGVNAELAIGSLRIAAGHFAKENIPLQQGLRDTMAAIKGASSESEGLAIAMDVFGARAGPDMAAAIREGRFELDDAVTALQATGGGLEDASQRALTMGDRMGIMKSKIMTSLLPIGETLMDVFEKNGLPLLEKFADWFSGTGAPAIQDFSEKAGAWISEFIERAKPIIDDFSKKWDETLAPAMLMVQDALKRISEALGISQSDFSAMDVLLQGLKYTLDAVVIAVQAVGLAFQGIAWVVEQIRSAVDAARGLWEQLTKIGDILSSGKFDLLGGVAGGLGALGINVPGFDVGGIVPGPVGSPQLILAHGGETVLPTHRGGIGGNTINVTINASNANEARRGVMSALRAAGLT